jgi:hypothetical protein
MCEFFSCIVTRLGDVLFTESESHETVIYRSGFVDNLKFFVRVEYDRKHGYIIDEKTIPEWYERIAAKAEKDVKRTHTKVLRAFKAKEKTIKKERRNYRAANEQLKKLYGDTGLWSSIHEDTWKEYMVAKRAAVELYQQRICNVEGYICPS